MKHLYFFVSNNTSDAISTLTIFTVSARKALALAKRAFKNNGYEGEPVMLAI